MLDLPIVHVTAVDSTNTEEKKNLTMQIGIISSALEHAVPEQMFTTDPLNPADAVSAVKALSKATQQGQRIYHITQANQATALQNINHEPETMAEITNALQTGKEVITHTDAISVPGWSGAGYIIFDPITGDGAYKISGGANGSYLDYYDGDLATGVLFALSVLGLLIGTPGALIAGLLLVFTLFHMFMTFMIIDLQVKGEGCLTNAFSTLTGAFSLAMLVVAKKFGVINTAFITSLYSFMTGKAVKSVSALCGKI